ncbi:MAG: hypothetical protein RLZZ608_806 [Actinomycetota bacterium]
MNKKHFRAVTDAALAAGAALILSACAMPMTVGGGVGTSGDGDQNMADVMFVQMMIPHHEQAVEMSELILAKDGVDPEVAALAEQIKAAQGPEIELMRQWLDGWGIGTAEDMGGMDHGGTGGMGGMDGMMSDEQMAQLESASGADGSALFLELMIEHHEGAVDMAEDVIDDGHSADVRALAEQIVTSQTAEIATMRDLLDR